MYMLKNFEHNSYKPSVLFPYVRPNITKSLIEPLEISTVIRFRE